MWLYKNTDNVVKFEYDCCSKNISSRNELKEHMKKNHMDLQKKEKMQGDLKIWIYEERILRYWSGEKKSGGGESWYVYIVSNPYEPT